MFVATTAQEVFGKIVEVFKVYLDFKAIHVQSWNYSV